VSQFWKLVSLPVLVASVVGCGTQRAASYEGRLDVEVRPDNAQASLGHLEGNLALRTQDGRTVDRLLVVNPYDTLSVALPEGAYLLDWQPVLGFQSEQEAAHASSALRTPFSVVADRVTTVHARVVVRSADAPDLPALGRDIPNVDILIARH
jgi:hypothetical protein